jgi:hypothetical protein
MRHWDVVAEATKIMNRDPGITKSYGMRKVVNEGIAALIQKAAMDYLSREFRGIPKHLVVQNLLDRTDELQRKWDAYAEKVHGINSEKGKIAGWEMIMDGGLIDLPGGDRYY